MGCTARMGERALAAACAVAVALEVAVPRAAAYPVKSQYTTIDLKACRKLKSKAAGDGIWTCAGLPGYPVWVAEGDLRTFISVGPDAAKRRAASQTLGPFNTIFAHGSQRATLEWRFDHKGEAVVPYATILRYFTRNEGGRGEVLVVAKVTRTETCHVAYIDALATPEPIVLAHKIADSQARTFDCSQEPLKAGEKGKSPM